MHFFNRAKQEKSKQEEENFISHDKTNTYKVIFVGDSGVGKTSLIHSINGMIFISKYKTTMGVDFSIIEHNYEEELFQLTIWDTAGQERFCSLGRMFYQGADCNAVVVHYSNILSSSGDLHTKGQKQAVKWLGLLRKNQKYIDKEENQGKDEKEDQVPSLLIISQADSVDGKQYDSNIETLCEEKLEVFCKENNFVGYIVTSARDNKNINDLTSLLCKTIKDNVVPESLAGEGRAEFDTLNLEFPNEDYDDNGLKCIPGCSIN